VDAVHRDCEARFRWAEEIGGDLTERGATRVARQIGGAGPGFALFNTLAAPRGEIVHQRIHFLEPGAAFRLVDGAGQPVPHQEVARRPMKIQWDPQRQHFHVEGRVHPAVVVSPPALGETGGRWQRWLGEEVEILFQADLPAGGYTTVRVLPATEEPAATTAGGELQSGPNWLENSRVRVEVAADGSFTLLDKTGGRRYGPLNVFRSEADRGDEYSFCPAEADTPVSSRDQAGATVTLVESGPPPGRDPHRDREHRPRPAAARPVQHRRADR
jgi:alpha-mannosidase